MSDVFGLLRLLSASVIVCAATQAEAAAVNFNIPPQALESALTQFGVQSGISVFYQPEVVAGRSSGGVTGSLEASDALQRLLQGTGLSFARAGAGFAIKAPDQNTTSMEDQSEAAKQLEGNVLDTVVVTGVRRRQEAVQDTPIAISALSAEMLDHGHVSDVKDIVKLAPNLQMDEIAGAGTKTAIGIYLRGQGTSQNDPANEPAISIVVDGITSPVVMAQSLDTFGLEGIEVQRGPQGTLVGKNAPTGVINVTTKRPTQDFGGKLQVDYGRYNRTEVRALINIPIVKDVLAVNFSGLKKYMDNWYYNVLTNKYDAGGTNAEGGRVGILFTPGNVVNWYVNGEYTHDHSPQVALRSYATSQTVQPFQWPGAACAISGFCTPIPPLSQKFAYASVDPRPSDAEKISVRSNLDLKFDAFTITSVTGYETFHLQNNGIDFTRLPVQFGVNHQTVDYNNLSQELRISSSPGGFLTFNDHLDWVIGGFYSRLDYNLIGRNFVYQGALNTLLRVPAGTFPANFGLNTPVLNSQVGSSYAVFGHFIGKITSAWNVSFGFRQSWDNKDHIAAGASVPGPAVNPVPSFGPPLRLQGKWDNLSFEAGTQYKFGPNRMAYFRFAQGYRAGGIQGTARTISSLFSLTYQPETVNSYEVGIKADWLDKRLRTNLTLFNNDYKDLQRNISFFTPGPTQIITNAASATIKGVELEATYVPTDNLTLHVTGGYLHTQYHNYLGFLASGSFPTGFDYDRSLNDQQKFPYAPRWTLDAGFDYTHDWGSYGVTVLSMDYDWRSDFNLNDQTIPLADQPSYGLANLSLRWEPPSGKYSITAYGRNVFSKDYRTYLVPSLSPVGTEGMPATWGIQFAANF